MLNAFQELGDGQPKALRQDFNRVNRGMVAAIFQLADVDSFELREFRQIRLIQVVLASWPAR